MNTGYFRAFLPDGVVMNVWGIADPTTLTSSTLQTTRRDGTVSTVVTPTVTQATGGVIVYLDPFSYSSPNFSIVPTTLVAATVPTAAMAASPSGLTPLAATADPGAVSQQQRRRQPF